MIPRGRALLAEELDLIVPEGWGEQIKELQARGMVKIQPGVDLQTKKCNRCGGSDLQFVECGSCEKECAYCTSCLQMGRSKVCTPLYLIEDEVSQPSAPQLTIGSLLEWKGQLTPSQTEASETACKVVRSTNEKLLIWAV